MAFNLTAQLRLQGPSNSDLSDVANKIRSRLRNMNIVVPIKFSTEGTKAIQQHAKAVTKATKTTKVLGKATRATSNDMGGFAKSIFLAGKRFIAFNIAAALSIVLLRKIGESIGEAIKFEDQLARVAQVSGVSLTRIQG